MAEKWKISNLQLFVILVVAVAATAILVLHGFAADHAGRDAWVPPITSTFPTLVMIMVLFKIATVFPKDTLYQYSEKITGAVMGKIIAVLYIFFFLHISAAVLSEFSALWTTMFLQQTPVIVIHAVLIIIAAYAVYEGLESFSRALLIFFPLMSLFFAIGLFAALPVIELQNLLPMLDTDIFTLLRATMAPTAWRLEMVILAFLLPYVVITKYTKVAAYGAPIFLGLVLTAEALVMVMVFGASLDHFIYPNLALFRQAEFLTVRLDPIYGVFLTGAIFFKLTIFYFLVVLGFKQVLRLNNARSLIIPVGILIIILSKVSFVGVTYTLDYLDTAFPPYAITMQFIIPLLLLIVLYARGLHKKPEVKE